MRRSRGKLPWDAGRQILLLLFVFLHSASVYPGEALEIQIHFQERCRQRVHILADAVIQVAEP
jgi:hypothetical protein